MYKNIRACDLKGLIGKVNIIDIRKRYLYNLGSIPSSINIPSSYLTVEPEKYMNRQEEYYIYCTAGMESPRVCRELTNKGFKVVNVLGGYNDYITC